MPEKKVRYRAGGGFPDYTPEVYTPLAPEALSYWGVWSLKTVAFAVFHFGRVIITLSIYPDTQWDWYIHPRLVDSYGFHVGKVYGKHTSPMDAMGFRKGHVKMPHSFQVEEAKPPNSMLDTTKNSQHFLAKHSTSAMVCITLKPLEPGETLCVMCSTLGYLVMLYGKILCYIIPSLPKCLSSCFENARETLPFHLPPQLQSHLVPRATGDFPSSLLWILLSTCPCWQSHPVTTHPKALKPRS